MKIPSISEESTVSVPYTIEIPARSVMLISAQVDRVFGLEGIVVVPCGHGPEERWDLEVLCRLLQSEPDHISRCLLAPTDCCNAGLSGWVGLLHNTGPGVRILAGETG